MQSLGGRWSPGEEKEKGLGAEPRKASIVPSAPLFLLSSLSQVVAPLVGGPMTQSRAGHSGLPHLLCLAPLASSWTPAYGPDFSYYLPPSSPNSPHCHWPRHIPAVQGRALLDCMPLDGDASQTHRGAPFGLFSVAVL